MTHETRISVSIGAVYLTHTSVTYRTKLHPRHDKQTRQVCAVKTLPVCMTKAFAQRLFPFHYLCHFAYILRDTYGHGSFFDWHTYSMRTGRASHSLQLLNFHTCVIYTFK